MLEEIVTAVSREGLATPTPRMSARSQRVPTRVGEVARAAPDGLQAFQRAVGNRAVARLVARAAVLTQAETTTSIAAMPLVDRLERSISSAARHLGPEVVTQLEEMLSPGALMMTAAFIASQFVGLGEAADAAGLGMLAWKIGTDAVQVASDLAAFASLTYRANSAAELETAGQHLAHAVTLAGVDTLMVLLAAKSKSGAKGEAEVTGRGLPPESAGASPRGGTFQAASAKTPRSLVTAIQSDIGESEAYKGALRRGEIGLERPQGANVPGRADFITARRAASGEWEIVVTDVKTTTTGKFPAPANKMPISWGGQIRAALSSARLDLGDAAIEGEIRAAFEAGRVSFRQVNVDYSAAGGGGMAGF